MIFANAEGRKLYLFDRSRVECAAECPRKYYWLYAFLGVGILKARDLPPYWPFETGHFIHEGIEMVLKGINGREAAEKVGKEYFEKWSPLLTANDISPENSAMMMMELQQEVDLVMALVYGWSLVGYPRFQANYTVVDGGIEQEEEISWLIDTDGEKAEVKLLTRTDILAQSLDNKVTHLFNLKSVSDPNEKWRTGFQRDMQTLTESMAVEARLGLKVDGIIIEGLVKGKNAEYPKGSGFWQSGSKLTYAWVKESGTGAVLPGESSGKEYASSWDYTCSSPHVMGNNKQCPGGRNHTLSKGAGWRKLPVRDAFPGGVIGWLDHLLRTEPVTLESNFLQLPAISRDEYQVERWKRQKLSSEKSRQDAAARVDEAFLKGDLQSAGALLDFYFDMYEGWQCFDCSYQTLCWDGASPFSEGDWKPRIPNHVLEAELIQQSLVQIEGVVEGTKEEVARESTEGVTSDGRAGSEETTSVSDG